MGLIATVAAAVALAAGGERVLVFTVTEGFRHEGCIDRGGAALSARFGADVTGNPAVFTRARLKRYDGVVFLCTTGDVLDAGQQRAFERFVRRGGGFAGVHSASDTEYEWPFYGRLVGAYFESHPAIQLATMRVERRRTAATRHLGRTWTRSEEWYSFRTNPRPRVEVLLSVDETTYEPSDRMGDHPVAWCRGDAFYTALGHEAGAWDEPAFRRHVFGGVRIALGRARCR